jgi:hypothetical protein
LTFDDGADAGNNKPYTGTIRIEDYQNYDFVGEIKGEGTITQYILENIYFEFSKVIDTTTDLEKNSIEYTVNGEIVVISFEGTYEKALCESYNVDFYSTEKPMFYKSCVGSIGDTNAIYEGLLWAKNKNLDILVKLSRRLIPCYEWKSKLIELAKESNASTFSSYCTKDPFNIRTECIAFNVNVWTKQYPLQCMKFTIDNELVIFAEVWFHELAKTLSGNNFNEKWLTYCKNNNFGYLHSGYAMWQDILGTCRYTDENRHIDTLWHMYNKPEDYLNELNKHVKDKYTINDL